MGKVATIFNVYADEGKSEEELSKEIGDKLKPKSMQIEEIAFGIKVIKVMFVHEDSEGSTSFEEDLKKVKGVREVEVDDETLL